MNPIDMVMWTVAATVMLFSIQELLRATRAPWDWQ